MMPHLIVRISRFLRLVIPAATLLLTAGCATLPVPDLVYTPGSVVNTLSAAASLSISKGEQGMGSSGYLLYQRPDRMRLVVLSPFGTTVMETIVVGSRVTIVNISKGVAFRGSLEELPRVGEGETWRRARWVMETDPPGTLPGNGTLERFSQLTGLTEKVVYRNGLVVQKSLANGDTVTYGDYSLVNGVPLAAEIVMHGADDSRFRIKLTEPEVNGELSPEAFTVNLDGLTVYPLAALTEQ